MKLKKNKDNKWISGVCSGIADKSGIHVGIIRLVFLFGSGIMTLLYIGLAVLLD
jgi:phage shock protein PspC (stress-responsive transcriptional regulator)